MQTSTAIGVLLLSFSTLSAQTDPARLRPLPSASTNVQTGPELGARIPSFRIPDQSGKLRDFRSLTGRNGLLLVFVRSADW